MSDNHDSPLVSVIIIFLNEERFLQEAIDSVFAQTYSHWELLLVDDGSTDKSSDIARLCADNQSDKVRYLEHENHSNRGMSASRNLGVRHAKGKYISYIDGDDVWFPPKLTEQVAILEKYPEAVMVFGPLQLWHSWDQTSPETPSDRLYNEYPQHYQNSLVKAPEMLNLFLRFPWYIPSGILVHRATLTTIGGGEEVFRGSLEDAVVHVKICLRYTVYVSSSCWYRYRIHPNSWTRQITKSGKDRSTDIFYLKWVEKYFREQGVKDSSIWKALWNAKFSCYYPRTYRLFDKNRFLLKKWARLLLPTSVKA
ncbi:MAG TPA: glycosyltransferase family 2 protein [Chroococcidiopsis sp.]